MRYALSSVHNLSSTGGRQCKIFFIEPVLQWCRVDGDDLTFANTEIQPAAHSKARYVFMFRESGYSRKILTPGNRVTRVMAHIDVSLYNSFIIISHDIMFIRRITLCELAISGKQLAAAIRGLITPFYDYHQQRLRVKVIICPTKKRKKEKNTNACDLKV